MKLPAATVLAALLSATVACTGTDSVKTGLDVTDLTSTANTSAATTPAVTPPTTTPPATTPPVAASSEPLPRSGDRLLIDGRVSMQQATSLANIWPGAPAGTAPATQARFEFMGNVAFAADVDGHGTHALRIDWTGFNGHCGDQEAEATSYLPTPFSKHVIFSWKQHIGRTTTGNGIGALNSFQVANTGNGCDSNAGRKNFLVCRENADNGCYDRIDYLWPGPAPVAPRIDNNNQNLEFHVLPGATFNPEEHQGETIVQTLELQAESSTGASDGIVRLWINGVKIIENLHARIGAETFNRFEIPSSYNSPAHDQSEYFWDMIAWVPQG